LEEAYQLATQMQKPVELAEIGGKLSVVKAELGQYEVAKAYSEEAIKIAQSQDLPEVEGQQLVMLAMTYFDLENQEKAKETISKAIDLYRKLEQPELLQRAETILMSFSRTP